MVRLASCEGEATLPLALGQKPSIPARPSGPVNSKVCGLPVRQDDVPLAVGLDRRAETETLRGSKASGCHREALTIVLRSCLSGGHGEHLPGCHHDCFMSCVNGEAVGNGPLVLTLFYLW